jgi:phosphohistidine swiveling domain-containing protein
MADRGPRLGRYVAPLDTIARGDIARAGGKGANLGELIRADHRVPRGFVVTTDAYTAALDHLALPSRTTGSHRDDTSHGGSDVDGTAIRADVAGAPIPDEVRAPIVEAYTALGDGPVAVRSSATVEDLVGAAFAGQHDTYLDIAGADEVIDAVRRCWASLWSDRAIAYRRRRGVSAAEARMAVVVQAMVGADIAGVMFTANPVTGARDEIVVDAGSGLGEAVVSGVVTPDHYVLDARGQVRRWQPGQRERVGEPSTDEVVRVSAPAGMRPLPVDARVELAQVGRDVAAHFGQPQDIEWAWAHGRVWLLQARPMTALPPPPVPLNRFQRVTGPPLLEMLPVRPFPLDMTAWIVPGPGRMVGRMLQEMIGLRVDLSGVLPERQEVVDRFVPPAPRPTLGLLTAPARDVGRIRRFDPAAWTGDARFAAYRRQVAALAARDPTTMPWAELASLPRQALDALDVVTDLRIDYLPRAAVALLRLRLTLRLLGLGELFPLLIIGAPTRTADANCALAELAARVGTDDTLRSLFSEVDADDPAAQLRRAREVHDFGAALDAFLDEYGHRETTSILLLSSPTWSEAPAIVFGAIRALVDQRTRPGSGNRRNQALQRLLKHPVVRGTRSQGRATRMVQAARAGIALREDTHFHATSVLPILRGAVQEMGRRLADTGVLDDAELVFHLRLAELEGATDPQIAPDEAGEQLRDVVQRRAAVRAQRAGAPLISHAVLFPDAAGDGAIVSGTTASGGRTTGPVRIIREPAEFGRLRDGDVLVCPYTNPAWTSLFQRAAAVVVDTGGQASHAAIVAREYGIPAVLGTDAATTRIRSGQMITVDGSAGTVLLEELEGGG